MAPPITYTAKLDGKSITLAQLMKLGKLTDGTVSFTESDPTARFRITFDGMPGLYRIRIELDVVDVRTGRRQMITAPEEVWVCVREESSD